MASLYVGEDDRALSDALVVLFRSDGHDASAFPEGASLLRAHAKHPCDLIVLDIMMPVLDGLQTLKAVRQFSSVPIILLTARDSANDQCAGLDLGADDYMTKPFSTAVLLAKVRALLRRSTISWEPLAPNPPVERSFGNVAYAASRREATVGGARVALTPTELRLLAFYLERPGHAVSRKELALAVWNTADAIEARSVDEANRRLRNKLLAAGADCFNETVWGYGYRFVRREGIS